MKLHSKLYRKRQKMDKKEEKNTPSLKNIQKSKAVGDLFAKE